MKRKARKGDCGKDPIVGNKGDKKPSSNGRGNRRRNNSNRSLVEVL